VLQGPQEKSYGKLDEMWKRMRMRMKWKEMSREERERERACVRGEGVQTLDLELYTVQISLFVNVALILF
jgi:hypothetical protein